MEIAQPEPVQEQESVSLYRERISSEYYLEQSLAKIDRLARGEGVLELTDVERATILEHESQLEAKLYDIFSPTVRSVTFDPEFLLTAEGSKFFSDKTGVTTLPEALEEVTEYLYNNTDVVVAMGKENRKELEGLAKKFRDEKVAQQLSNQINENGDLISLEADMGERLGIILDPDKLLTKESSLREFKAELKKQYLNLKDDGNFAEAEKEIINLYIHRINLMLASIAGSIRAVARKAEIVGPELLSDSEMELLKVNSGTISSSTMEQRERYASRYDRFIHGASLGYTNRERPQVDKELADYAEMIGKKWLDENLSREAQVEANGISYEKINEKTLTPDERKEVIEGHLASLGILNTDKDAEDEDTEAPPEQKSYKVKIKQGSRSASVGQKYRKLFIPNINASIATLLSTEAGHEVGHVLQGVNGSEIPLKIFERIGGGGSTAFSEGGAISVQSKITKALFGYEVTNHPHYIRAMVEKLNGGNYLDTVRVFYQSAVEPFQIQYRQSQLSEEEFRDNVEKCLILAVDRSQRLFRHGRRSSKEPVLSSSKDTAYVEQFKIAEALMARGQEKLLLIRGMSFENICSLLKLGFLKLDQLKEPNYDYLKSVWDREKSKYALDEQPNADSEIDSSE